MEMLEDRSGQCQEGRGAIPTLLMETEQSQHIPVGVTAKGRSGRRCMCTWYNVAAVNTMMLLQPGGRQRKCVKILTAE